MHDLLIAGARILTTEGAVSGDIAVTDGRIAAIGTGLGPARETLDAGGRPVAPGGVDPHAHMEQMSGMGLMTADSFETAHAAALAGGTTSVISFAAQAKGQRLAEAMADYAARARRGAMADHAFHILVSDPTVPEFAADLGRLLAEGHRSVKIFTTYLIALADRQILDVMAAARAGGGLVCVHAENDGLIGWTKDALVAAGRVRPADHALSHPRMAEVEAIERICRFAEYLDQPVMIFHVSTAEGVAAIRAARARGAPVAAETCPHYLLQTAEALEKPGVEGAKWMCSPPQRTAADQAALWRALAAGDLGLVSSDHAPYAFDETGKLSAGPTPPFPKIANGMPGLRMRLPLMWDAMVARGGLGEAAFVRLTATAPARLHGLASKGRIAPGMDADLVIWDPDARRVVAEDLTDGAAGYMPWAGREVTGWPDTVILRGRIVARDGAVAAAPGSGRFLPRDGHGVPRGTGPAPEATAAGGATGARPAP